MHETATEDDCDHNEIEIWVDASRAELDGDSELTAQRGRCIRCRRRLRRIRDEAWGPWEPV